MKTLRLLKRDMAFGIFRRWYVFMIPLILGIAGSYECHSWIASINGSSYKGGETIADYVMYCMQGDPPMLFQPTLSYTLPIVWTIFQIGAAYMIAYYAREDFEMTSAAIFIAAGERRSWWRSKYIWCVLSVIGYYMVYYLTIVAAASFYGADLSPAVTRRLLYVYGVNTAGLSMSDMLYVMICLPMLITISVSLVQMLVSFICSTVVSFAAVCAMYVLSAYYTVWFLPGNYTMWRRCSYLSELGLDPGGGLFMAVVLIVVSVISGRVYFAGKDIC